jgi:hypothetical protein
MVTFIWEMISNNRETSLSEILGDLARYYMAILREDAGNRKFWLVITGIWFNKAADKYPHDGRF